LWEGGDRVAHPLNDLHADTVNSSPANPQRVLVLDEGLLVFLLTLEVNKAIRLQYCLSVFCLAPDLPMGEVAPTLLNRLAEAAICQLRATDVAASFPAPHCVMLLLVDANARALPGIFQRLITALEATPLNGKREGQRFTFSAGGGCYPQTAANGNELLRQAMDLLVRAKSNGGDRLYLPA
jgi:hypothetical protein